MRVIPLFPVRQRSYLTRGTALGAAKQIVNRKLNYIRANNGEAIFWSIDNVVVEEVFDGWRWYIDMPDAGNPMAEVEAQERLDMEDEAYFERIASEDKEEAQDEAPRELTVEQALEIAAQQTEAVDEEFRAVEARHRAEATVSVSPRQEDLAQLTNPSEPADEAELNKVKEMTSMELSIAASTGKGTLAETISRMEMALKHLKQFQSEYKEAAKDSEENAFYMAERLRRASNEIHGYICISLAIELATTAGSLEQLAKVACRLDMDGE